MDIILKLIKLFSISYQFYRKKNIDSDKMLLKFNVIQNLQDTHVFFRIGIGKIPKL